MGAHRSRRQTEVRLRLTPESGPDGQGRILYGRRRGRRLRPRRQALVSDLLPRLALSLPADGAADFDPLTVFTAPVPGLPDPPHPHEVRIEVGFGAGEHLAAQARNHPEIGFIGCEPYINGVAALLGEIERLGLGNIRIFMDDARKLIDALAGNSIARVDLLFPDPWPKKRHHKRRFICPETLDQLARIIRDGGELRFASDDCGLVRWTLEAVLDHGDFIWLANRPCDWRRRPADSIATRYEAKANEAGRTCVFLRFARLPRPAKAPRVNNSVNS